MDVYSNFILNGSLLLLIVGGVFTLTMVLSSQRDEREKGCTPIYSERCGGRFGLINFTVPFVRLALYEDFMVISCWTRRTIEYKNIRRLQGRGLLDIGIEIVTININKYGQPIIWSFNQRQIMNIINEKIETNHKSA